MMFFTPNKPLGLVEGRLRNCPDSPNCVCSQETRPDYAIAPFPFTRDVAVAKTRLLEAVATLPRTKVITNDDEYLHITCTSLLMRYVDDLEFQIDPTAGVIHVRSASRVGYSDLGVNRQRVEAVRRAWNALNK